MATTLSSALVCSRQELMAKRRRAYRQGDLDGLCGVYSIVNALRHVLREL
jgi:hypothetical protein